MGKGFRHINVYGRNPQLKALRCSDFRLIYSYYCFKTCRQELQLCTYSKTQPWQITIMTYSMLMTMSMSSIMRQSADMPSCPRKAVVIRVESWLCWSQIPFLIPAAVSLHDFTLNVSWPWVWAGTMVRLTCSWVQASVMVRLTCSWVRAGMMMRLTCFWVQAGATVRLTCSCVPGCEQARWWGWHWEKQSQLRHIGEWWYWDPMQVQPMVYAWPSAVCTLLFHVAPGGWWAIRAAWLYWRV